MDGLESLANQAYAAIRERAHVRYGLTEVSGQIRTLSASEWREPRRRGRHG
jgi:hypothetical protein